MLSLLRSLTLLAAIEWASLVVGTSVWLKAYFRAQIVYTLLLGVLLFVHADEWFYEMCFTILTLTILVSAAGFVWEYVKNYEIRWLILVQALVLPNVLVVGAYQGLHASLEVIPSYIWISLGESAALMTLGIALSTVAPLVERGKHVPAVTLAVLWLLLGAYEYGFSLLYPMHEQAWNILNEFVPATLVVMAFFVIGWRQRCLE